jgi:hypothetical protein
MLPLSGQHAPGSLLCFSNALFPEEEKRLTRLRLPLRGFGQVFGLTPQCGVSIFRPFFFPGNPFCRAQQAPASLLKFF